MPLPVTSESRHDDIAGMTTRGFMRRMPRLRLRFLRFFITLAVYLIAVPGTLMSSGSGGVLAASVFEAEVIKPSATERNVERNIADDEVRVLFCTACGYHQNFAQIKTYIEDTFPHLTDRVYGANMDVEPWKTVLAQVLQYSQYTAMFLAIFGEYLLPPNPALSWALNNRIPVFFMLMLLGSLASQLTATGAFEIYFNGDLIFSKLHEGRWPTLLEISNAIGDYGMLDTAAA